MTEPGDGADAEQTRTAEQIRTAYAERAAGVQHLLDGTGAQAWDAPSACTGWTGRDVVAHLVDSQRDFFRARGLDLGARPDLADPAQAWRAHAAAVRSLLAEPGVVEHEYEDFGGERTTIGSSVEAFLGFDMIVHRWDVAAADGRAYAFSDADLDVIEGFVAAMGSLLYSEGVCAPALDVPPEADRRARVLAALGRRATVDA